MCLAISIYENKASAFYYIENESQRERETELFAIWRASWGWMKERKHKQRKR